MILTNALDVFALCTGSNFFSLTESMKEKRLYEVFLGKFCDGKFTMVRSQKKPSEGKIFQGREKSELKVFSVHAGKDPGWENGIKYLVFLQVDTFFSRDLDSRINHREVAAVREFLSSDKSVHVMRDHPAHVAYMMGGMWGAKVNETRKQFLKSFKNMFKVRLGALDHKR